MKTAHLEITHNPITLQTALLVDGERVDKLDEIVRGGRMQGWIERLLDAVHDAINEDDLAITYRGIEQDAGDLAEVLEVREGHRTTGRSYSYDLTSHAVPFNAEQVADRFLAISRRLEAFAKEVGADETEMDLLRAVRGLIELKAFRVAAVACVSSGKSTLLNAMLAREVLPARNEATTAKISRLIDVDGQDTVEVTVRSHEGEVVLHFDDAGLEDLDAVNERADVADVEVKTDMTWIDNMSMGHLELMDTPGPNNSATQDHRVLTHAQLGQSETAPDVVLYVMDFRHQAVDDERNLLTRVSKEIAKGGLEANDRFFFVLNFIDDRDPDREPLGRALANLEGFLDREFGIKNPRIFPVSAMGALLDRLSDQGRALTRRQQRMVPLMAECLPGFDELLAETRCQSAVKAATRALVDHPESNLARSGLPTLQAAIVQHLEKYAMPTKLARYYREMQARLLTQTKEAEFEAEIFSQDRKITEIQRDLDRLEAVVKRADVTAAVEGRLTALKRRYNKKPFDAASRLEVRIVKFLNESDFAGSGKLAHADAKRAAAKLGKQISDAAAEMEAAVRDQVEGATVQIRDEVVKVFREQLADLVAKQNVDTIKLPDANMWTANLSLKLESKATSVAKTEQKTRTVTKTRKVKRSWYNPKRWLTVFDDEWSTYEEEYETTQKYKVRQVEKEKFRRAVQADLNRQLKAIRTRAMSFRSDQLEILSRRVLRLIKEANATIASKLGELKRKTASKDRLAQVRAQAEERRKCFVQLREDLDEAAGLGLES